MYPMQIEREGREHKSKNEEEGEDGHNRNI
jgi:hypothetical protein